MQRSSHLSPHWLQLRFLFREVWMLCSYFRSLLRPGRNQLEKMSMKKSTKFQPRDNRRVLISSINIKCFDVPEHHSSFHSDIPG